jgi:hypothetical protein
MTASTTHATPRATLFSSTFFAVLPSHYSTICTRWDTIARLHYASKHDFISTERAGAVSSLRSELEMLDDDISQYRELVRNIDIIDIAGIYVCGGRGRRIALNIAKEDLEDMKKSLEEIEEKVKEIKAELSYEFEEDSEKGESGWGSFDR